MPSPAQPSVFGAQHLIDRLRCWVRRPLIFQSRLSPPLRRDALGHQAVGAAERFAWLTPELDPRWADEIGKKINDGKDRCCHLRALPQTNVRNTAWPALRSMAANGRCRR